MTFGISGAPQRKALLCVHWITNRKLFPLKCNLRNGANLHI